MQPIVLVFLGAGIGGVLRHLVNLACAKAFGTAFPWGTLAVNAVGGFAMGALAGYLAFKAGEGWSQPLRLFLATGVLGGFTTFSAFSLDAVLMWERGDGAWAAIYVLASVGLAIGGLMLGLAAARAMT